MLVFPLPDGFKLNVVYFFKVFIKFTGLYCIDRIYEGTVI